MENPVIKSESDGYEIDIRKLVKTIFQNKKRFIKNLMVALGLWFVILVGYSLINYNSSTYYSLILGLNFPQAAQGKYPNGSSLSASDLVSNTVLESVWAENGLGQKGISFEKLQKMITSTPYLGEINFIDAKFKGMLSQKNLSRNDIEKIETDYRNEIQAAASKSIKLTLDTKDVSIDSAVASKILNDVAKSWSQIAIEKLGVSRSSALDGIALDDGMKSASPYIVVTYLNDVIAKLEGLLSAMRQEPNINSYRDAKSNLNLAGIFSKIQDISKYQVDELDAFVAINTKPTDWEMLQTQYRLKELYANKAALEKSADVYRKALIDYSSTTSQASSNSSGELRNKSSNGVDGSGVQINGDAITKIFSLATESKDSEYRQEITSKRIEVENQANSLNVQIQKLERRISAASKSVKFTEATKGEYLGLLDKTWDSLSQAISVVTRIQSMAQKDFIGDSGVLYTVINQPLPYSPSRSRWFIFAAISFFSLFLIGLITTFIQIFISRKDEVVI
jgi:hypothetical protein